MVTNELVLTYHHEARDFLIYSWVRSLFVLMPDQNGSSKTREWLFRASGWFLSHFPPFPFFLTFVVIVFWDICLLCACVWDRIIISILGWPGIQFTAQAELSSLPHWVRKIRDTVLSLRGHDPGIWTAGCLTTAGSWLLSSALHS